MSIPGIRGLVPRYQTIEVEYSDRNGKHQKQELTDFVARIFQHELDHLDGIVFLDRIESTLDLVTEQEYPNLNPSLMLKGWLCEESQRYFASLNKHIEYSRKRS